ncbi:MAG: hypothetical protein V4612_07635 [Pseudomonadota bacterium]
MTLQNYQLDQERYNQCLEYSAKFNLKTNLSKRNLNPEEKLEAIQFYRDLFLISYFGFGIKKNADADLVSGVVDVNLQLHYKEILLALGYDEILYFYPEEQTINYRTKTRDADEQDLLMACIDIDIFSQLHDPSRLPQYQEKLQAIGNSTNKFAKWIYLESIKKIYPTTSDNDLLRLLQESVAYKNAKSQSDMVYFLLSGGLGFVPNAESPAQAFRLMKKSACQGFSSSQKHLADYYASGFGVEVSYPDAIYWYQKAILQANESAKIRLATLYENIGQYDYAISLHQEMLPEGLTNVENIQRCQELHLVQSRDRLQLQAALNYQNEEGASIDIKKAFAILKELIGKKGIGDVALLEMNKFYKKGAWRKIDDPEFKLAIYTHFAEQDTEARFYYCDHLRKTADPEKAFALHKKFADQGIAIDQYYTAMCYRDGLGVAKDYDKALRFFALAADNGYPKAQSIIARQYELKAENEHNNEVKNEYLQRAFIYYRESALDGNHASQAKIAKFYEAGIVVEKDLQKAVYWYFCAAKAGDKDAANNLFRILEDEKVILSEYALLQLKPINDQFSLSKLGLLQNKLIAAQNFRKGDKKGKKGSFATPARSALDFKNAFQTESKLVNEVKGAFQECDQITNLKFFSLVCPSDQLDLRKIIKDCTDPNLKLAYQNLLGLNLGLFIKDSDLEEHIKKSNFNDRQTEAVWQYQKQVKSFLHQAKLEQISPADESIFCVLFTVMHLPHDDSLFGYLKSDIKKKDLENLKVGVKTLVETLFVTEGPKNAFLSTIETILKDRKAEYSGSRKRSFSDPAENLTTPQRARSSAEPTVAINLLTGRSPGVQNSDPSDAKNSNSLR